MATKAMLEAFEGVVLAKAASRKFVSVSRTLRDLSMIEDAKSDQEIGTNIINKLIAGAKAAKDQKDQQFKSDNSLHKKIDALLTRQDEQDIKIAKWSKLMTSKSK